MPIHKSFGAVPTTKVLVRIQEVEAGKVMRTRTASVHGSDFDTVVEQVDTSLAEAFGAPEDTVEPVSATEARDRGVKSAPPAKATIKKSRR